MLSVWRSTSSLAPWPIAPVTITATTPAATLDIARIALVRWANNPRMEIRRARSVLIEGLQPDVTAQHAGPAKPPRASRPLLTREGPVGRPSRDSLRPSAFGWLQVGPPGTRTPRLQH